MSRHRDDFDAESNFADQLCVETPILCMPKLRISFRYSIHRIGGQFATAV